DTRRRGGAARRGSPEHHFVVRRRPARVVSNERRQLTNRLCLDLDLPDGRDTTKAIRRERNAPAVAGPVGLLVVEGTVGERSETGSIHADRVDVPAVVESLEREGTTVGRPGGTAGFDAVRRDPFRL